MENEQKMPLNDLIRTTMDKVHEMVDMNTIVGKPIDGWRRDHYPCVQGELRLCLRRQRFHHQEPEA